MIANLVSQQIRAIAHHVYSLFCSRREPALLTAQWDTSDLGICADNAIIIATDVQVRQYAISVLLCFMNIKDSALKDALFSSTQIKLLKSVISAVRNA